MRGTDESPCEFLGRAGEEIVSPYVQIFDYAAFCCQVKFNDALRETPCGGEVVSRRLAEIPLVCAVAVFLEIIDSI